MCGGQGGKHGGQVEERRNFKGTLTRKNKTKKLGKERKKKKYGQSAARALHADKVLKKTDGKNPILRREKGDLGKSKKQRRIRFLGKCGQEGAAKKRDSIKGERGRAARPKYT